MSMLRRLTILLLIPIVVGSSLTELSAKLLGEYTKRHRSSHPKKSDWSNFYETIPIKPSSSAMIPLDIQENPNKDLDPDMESVDEYELLTILGDDYDRQFMALRKPLEMKLYPEGRLHYQLDNKKAPEESELPAQLQALSKREIKMLDDSPPLRVRFSRRIRRKLQKFLWTYSYCPVRYKWKELSVRFWPRWIRTGSCDSKRSCSIPEGMTCQPSQMRNIKILRYYCPIVGSKQNCHWIKFQYPILDKCSCACQNQNNNDIVFSGS